MSDSTTSNNPLPRLTKDVREALLDANEGFTDSTYYSAKNFSESRQYEITGGELHVKSNSKTSWADSRRHSEFIADEAATHRFLRERLPRLSLDGVEENAAARKAAREAARKAARKAARLAEQEAVREAAHQTERAGVAASSTVGQAEDAADAALDAVTTSGRTPPVPARIIALASAGLAAGIWLAPKAKRRWQRWRTERCVSREEATQPTLSDPEYDSSQD